jgi:tight adherence protein C
LTPLLAAAGVVLAFAAAWELAGAAEGRLGRPARRILARALGGRPASLDDAALRLRLPERLARAGLAGRVEPGAVIAAKLAGAAVGALVALLAVPAVPARLGVAVAVVLVVAGFLGPDALLERAARRRRARLVASLPDALDMLAVGAACGRGPVTVLGEIAAVTSGPLAAELATAVAEIECGAATRAALERLRRRAPGGEVGALGAALERSRVHGSSLAEQLHLQATTLRQDARRRIGDHAARAAPKIQLVVALVLVPSVLLMVLAAIVAHSGALLGDP